MAMEIDVYDDPLDPYGWGTEPALRTLRAAAPDAEVRLHPTLLIDDWERYDGPEFPDGRGSVAAVCSRVSEESGMPIDEYLWFSDPPSTSRPACRGVAAALDRGTAAGWRFLRAAREATVLRQTNLDTEAAVRELAEAVPDLDAEAFGDALADAEIERRETDDRGPLPRVVVDGPEGRRESSGRVDGRELAHLVERATGSPSGEPELSVPDAVERFSPEGWLATAELSALSGRRRDAAVAAAREADDVAEAEFASESFFRADEFVDE